MSQPDIIVVGAGPAGLISAITAARLGAKVQILEGTLKGGKKLLTTGNGRCNLTTLDPAWRERYLSMEDAPLKQLTEAVCHSFGPEDTRQFFAGLGVMTTHREDYVYPRSMQSSTVADALFREVQRLGITLRGNTKVTQMVPGSAGGFTVFVEGYAYQAKRVILCTGSMAAPATGSDGSGYHLARSLGHRVHPPLPALTGLVSPDPDIRLCAGARTSGNVQLAVDGRMAGVQRGEIQWTQDGLSGIAVFNLSLEAARALAAQRQVQLFVDLMPELSRDVLEQFMQQQTAHGPTILQTLSGMVHARVAEYLVRRSQLTKQQPLTPDVIPKLSGLLKSLSIPINATKDFAQAQTCIGGVSLSEVIAQTLESKCVRGLYLAGEVLDLHGPCGGYNLQWAWSSGAVAGRAASRDINSHKECTI